MLSSFRSHMVGQYCELEATHTICAIPGSLFLRTESLWPIRMNPCGLSRTSERGDFCTYEKPNSISRLRTIATHAAMAAGMWRALQRVPYQGLSIHYL